MTKIQKIIRILTVAPIMALLTLCILYLSSPSIFGSPFFFIVGIICLTIFPLLAYPLQPLIPVIKDQGRIGQRNLAIVMAVLGYIASVIVAVVKHAPQSVWLIFLSYLISGLLIQFFTVVIKQKASGHACGVTGPICLLVYFLGVWWLLLIPLLLFVCVISYRSGRHTKLELSLGVLVGVLSFAISVGIAGLL